MKLGNEQSYFARSQVGRWLRTKFKFENRGLQATPELKRVIAAAEDYESIPWRDIPGIEQLCADAEHSALLIHLLTGHEPLPEPPRLEHAYPVYPRDDERSETVGTVSE